MEHVTLGQQVIDVQTKYAGQKTQTIRETTEAMGKDYMKYLWDTIKANEKFSDREWYIIEVLRPSALLEGVMELKLHPRFTRPLPEWGIGLWKIQKGGIPVFEWGLPRVEEALMLASNPEGWDSKYVKDVFDYVQGKLV